MKLSNDNFNVEFIEDICKDVYALQDKDNSFCVFKSIHDIFCIAYPNIDYSLIFYDIINNTKIVEIKKAHNTYIIELRHYFDCINKFNKRDLILSVSYNDRNAKIWNFNNLECIFNINPYNNGIINSACFLYDFNLNEIMIIVSNNTDSNIKEAIKIYNLSGNEIKEINNSHNEVIYINSYHDNKYNKNYIISANRESVISYDYEQNIKYKTFIESNSLYDCTSVIIINDTTNDIVKLIYSTGNGFIKIWNFHLGILLEQIKINEGYIFSICLLEGKYLFSCGKYYEKNIIKKNMDKSNIKIIHINNETTCKLINIKNLGNYLITKNLSFDGPLKLWKIKI